MIKYVASIQTFGSCYHLWERRDVQGIVVGVLNTVIPYNHSFQEQDEGEVISKTRQSMNENLKSLYHETKKKSHLKIRRSLISLLSSFRVKNGEKDDQDEGNNAMQFDKRTENNATASGNSLTSRFISYTFCSRKLRYLLFTRKDEKKRKFQIHSTRHQQSFNSFVAYIFTHLRFGQFFFFCW